MLLKNGFYFSYKYNLTQAFRHQKEKRLANKFTWNKNLLIEMDTFNVDSGWKCPIIQGFVKSF